MQFESTLKIEIIWIVFDNQLGLFRLYSFFYFIFGPLTKSQQMMMPNHVTCDSSAYGYLLTWMFMAGGSPAQKELIL